MAREERFLDKLLLASVLECRGAERFKLIADALEDVELKRFYKALWTSEAKHGHVFVAFALVYFDETEVYKRLERTDDGRSQHYSANSCKSSATLNIFL